MRNLYLERGNALAAALSATLPDALDVTLPNGGTHLLAHLRGEERDVRLRVAAERQQRAQKRKGANEHLGGQ